MANTLKKFCDINMLVPLENQPKSSHDTNPEVSRSSCLIFPLDTHPSRQSVKGKDKYQFSHQNDNLRLPPPLPRHSRSIEYCNLSSEDYRQPLKTPPSTQSPQSLKTNPETKKWKKKRGKETKRTRERVQHPGFSIVIPTRRCGARLPAERTGCESFIALWPNTLRLPSFGVVFGSGSWGVTRVRLCWRYVHESCGWVWYGMVRYSTVPDKKKQGHG